MSEWKKLENSAEKGPTSFLIRIVVILFIVGAVGGTLAYVGGWFSEGGRVIQQEFGPQRALEKYEWFKDAAGQLEAKKANIDVYQGQLKALEDAYANPDGTAIPRNQWDRTDKENYNLRSQELAGMKASYNQLAAEYNAQSSKFNWAPFKGNSDEPPHEFKELVH